MGLHVRGITLGANFSYDIEESEGGLPGDVNLDGVVDFFDIQPFIEILTNQGFQLEADIDGSGVVDFFDITPFIGLLGG